MPSQAHLFIGRRVATEACVRTIAVALGADAAKINANPNILPEGWHKAETAGMPERSVVFQGRTYSVIPQLMFAFEETAFPADPSDGGDTGALLGFPLTALPGPHLGRGTPPGRAVRAVYHRLGRGRRPACPGAPVVA